MPPRSSTIERDKNPDNRHNAHKEGRNMTLKYPAMLIQNEKTGVFTIQFCDIPVAITQGNTQAEALNEGTLLIEETLEFNYFEQDREIPLPSDIEDITLEDIKSYFSWLDLKGNARDYLDYVKLPEELSQKILEHNEKIYQAIA
jgi:predicted RNase H-like HicB family nuclease